MTAGLLPLLLPRGYDRRATGAIIAVRLVLWYLACMMTSYTGCLIGLARSNAADGEARVASKLRRAAEQLVDPGCVAYC
jgi:hypothetical protein